ncbi:MAG: transcriptional regulator [Spirochaetaceae bacterium]|jgi:hypothetical protein|nr:transcriptional regulator [Spirochaetaceae bacterium]
MDEIKRQASDDFSKARAKEIFSRIKHFLHTGRNRLLSLNDVKKILRPTNESYAGIRAVPVNLIVGSEGRYRDFNKYFLPKSEHLRSRWERVDEARLSDIILPPIQLYEIGGVYFVRDGNHRVSVAMMQGVEMVDAEVISLSTKIQISPNMTIDELKAALLAYEKSIFYKKTKFAELTGCGTLDFTMPGRYDVIYEHILVHKYYLNLPQSKEVPLSDALISWYNTVYLPIVSIITEENLCSHFPQRTPSDLYVWIVKHWDELKKKYGIHYALSEAVRDFSARYGQSKGSAFALIKGMISGIFDKR